MGQLSKSSQAEMIQKLGHLFGSVYLVCDGHFICARAEQTAQNRIGILVYIDGKILGEMIVDSFQGRPGPYTRFWRPRSRAVCTKKQLKVAERVFGKKRCKENGWYKRASWYDAEWTSPRAFLRHLMKNNQDIAIVDHDQYDAGLAEKRASITAASE